MSFPIWNYKVKYDPRYNKWVTYDHKKTDKEVTMDVTPVTDDWGLVQVKGLYAVICTASDLPWYGAMTYFSSNETAAHQAAYRVQAIPQDAFAASLAGDPMPLADEIEKIRKEVEG